MERIVSPEERIRRAEEIYYRRKAQGVRVTTTSVNVGKKNKISLGKKMTIQIIACIIIYAVYYALNGYNNVFSNSFINQTKTILSYDINFINLYNNGMEYFNNSFNSIIKKEDIHSEENNSTDNSQENTEVVDNSSNEVVTNEQQNEQVEETNDGVQEEVNQSDEQQIDNATEITDGTIKAQEDAQNMDQMQQDAEFIKQNLSVIKPLEGIITSEFGSREETDIISAFHQGIDIRGNTGTPFYAAIEGDVVAASFAGDYGNHIKIQNGEVLTVYAHCSELEVNVGDHVTQGQEIGKVGATGKVTGPHLHFEIRREGRYIDPKLILDY